jgi:hypothetical protein
MPDYRLIIDRHIAGIQRADPEAGIATAIDRLAPISGMVCAIGQSRLP